MKRSEKIRIGVSLLILAVSVTIVIVPLYLVVLNSLKLVLGNCEKYQRSAKGDYAYQLPAGMEKAEFLHCI